VTVILVVDDEPVIRDSIRELLESRGLEIKVASTCQEAFECAARDPPDLLIVDRMLGGDMDGLQLANSLRETRPHLPTIVITGYPSEELQARVDAMPETWLFNKPWPFEQLLQLITRLLQTNCNR
jgi:CheY-like chemotaxis protein